jgi:hypothetical protein
MDEHRALIDKIHKASNYIYNNTRRGTANWVMLGDAHIQHLADELGVTFDEMVKLIDEAIKRNNQ